MGRPKSHGAKLTPEQKQELLLRFKQYVQDTPDPQIVGFCVTDTMALDLYVTDDNLADWAEFAEARRQAIMKSEYWLTHEGAKEALPMAIFRLKQPYHGYRDRFEQDITTNGEKLTFVNTLPRTDPSVLKDKKTRSAKKK